MTRDEAKKLKVNDWVWAFQLGTAEDMTPTYCYVFASKPDITHGLIKLSPPSGKPFIAQLSTQVFMTREETEEAMLKSVQDSIDYYEQENKKLMESIEDELAYNNRQLTRLTGLKAILTR